MKRIIVAVGALVVLLSSSIGSVSADQYLGNAIIANRSRTDGERNSQSATSNFLVLDLNPASTIVSEGNLINWRWYAKSWATNDLGQEMDLMIWRPVAATSSVYELVLKQRVVSDVMGEKVAAYDPTKATGSTLIKPGDVLGYYVPEHNAPVLALDYLTTSGGDYYWLGCGNIDVGVTHAFTAHNGIRTYSLGADIAEPEDFSPVPEPGTLIAAFTILSPAAALFRRRRG